MTDFALDSIVQPEPEELVEPQIDEYDLTSSPNDFNVSTLFSFIDHGSVKIPAFQRNYVWDIKRASRLIESIIIGLPIPQVFLYEQGRNQFLVVDGQQRLMTIFYFMRGRFPKPAKRAELRKIFDDTGSIPTDILNDNQFFDSFRLRLPDVAEGVSNKFAGMTYNTLGDYRMTFELRTIRHIIVKQVSPSDGDSSIFEMFNRLNTGGVLLTPQEIRTSMYHSEFLTSLTRLNSDPRWRRLLGQEQPDNHARDIEVLLRATAVWLQGAEYVPSMTSFLNLFAQKAARWQNQQILRLLETWDWFLAETELMDTRALRGSTGRLSVAVFDAAFGALARHRSSHGAFSVPSDFFSALSEDDTFRLNTEDRPTDRAHVRGRVNRANELLDRLLAADAADE